MARSDRSTTSLYLDLVRSSVSGAIHADQYAFVADPAELVGPELAEQLQREGVHLIRARQPKDRWVVHQVSMVAANSLRHLQRCVEDLIQRGIPGDLIEAGAWRGGASILMRAVLAAHGVRDRRVYVADSFEGLPPPDERYPADAGDRHHTIRQLAVSLEEVQSNFGRYGLLDDQVRFLRGWFEETLPTVRDRVWALVRIDGDMYSSTMQALECLYPGLAVGGIVVIDDYGAVQACSEAVEDFRRRRGISEPLREVVPGRAGVFWARER
ncbi:MAG: TylF/MycF/NovP-related O-methyltransferase [Egibacteraceae bacterium]